MQTMQATLVAAEEKLVTGEQLYAMGDIGPCELIEGRIVPMSPTGEAHGGYAGNICYHLRSYVEQHDLGKVRVGEVGIYIRRAPDTIRAADVLFISHERSRQRGDTGFMDVAPDLVVEIMSPADSWTSVTEKLRDCFEAGVRLVWVANPGSKSVFAYRSLTESREFVADENLTAEDILPGFSVSVAELFEA